MSRADPEPDRELERLKDICDGEPRRIDEGGREYVLLPGLRYLHGAEPRSDDALLSPKHPHPSYPTRLYFTQKIPPAPGCASLNWHEEVYVDGRTWYTWSWKDVTPDQSLLNIVAAHLQAFRP